MLAQGGASKENVDLTLRGAGIVVVARPLDVVEGAVERAVILIKKDCGGPLGSRIGQR